MEGIDLSVPTARERARYTTLNQGGRFEAQQQQDSAVLNHRARVLQGWSPRKARLRSIQGSGPSMGHILGKDRGQRLSLLGGIGQKWGRKGSGRQRGPRTVGMVPSCIPAQQSSSLSEEERGKKKNKSATNYK